MGQTPCSTTCCSIRGIADKSPFGAAAEADCLLIRASSNGDTIAIREALAGGADINAQLPILMRMDDEDVYSVLGDEKNDADLTGPEARSLTPLMYASDAGHLEAVELLLSYDARSDVRDPDGMQALHFAAQSASAACFRALLEAGANPLVKDNFDCDALDYVPLAGKSHAMKKEWLALRKDAGGLFLAGAHGVRVKTAEEIEFQAEAVWQEAETAVAARSSSLNKRSTVEATSPSLKNSNGITGAMPSDSSSQGASPF